MNNYNAAIRPETAVRPETAARPNTVPPPKPADFWQVVFIIIFLIICSLGPLFKDEQRVLYMTQTAHQAFSLARDAVARGLASGLNGLLEHVNHFLQAAGIQVGLPINTVTPEGVDFGAQWVLLLLICYGVVAITFLLATFLLSWLWWFLKVGVALACFGLIMKDHSVGIETTAMRLVCLGSVCILMSIRLWKDRTMAAKIVHLEEQLKILEYRGREMERWRRRFITLSCCVIGFLCLVFFIVFRIYIVMTYSKTS